MTYFTTLVVDRILRRIILLGCWRIFRFRSTRCVGIKSLLDVVGITTAQVFVNTAQLKSLSPEWNTHAVVWRNKADLDTMSKDDLYNNLKVYKPEVKGISSSNSSTQNMAFVSSSYNNTSNTNEAVNTAHGVSTAIT
ncbi:hypothetical protein Tco_0012205 [Tanacetum coccineum]